MLMVAHESPLTKMTRSLGLFLMKFKWNLVFIAVVGMVVALRKT